MLSHIDRVIVALDCEATEAMNIAACLAGHARWLKVGMTLYYREGPRIVSSLKEKGFSVFLDLKLHDIPHQVEGAAAALVESGADMFTLHASGGEQMMSAAQRGAERAALACGMQTPISLGVTVLTCMDDEALHSVGVQGDMAAQVERLAGLVSRAGVSGVVCSPLEARAMRRLLGPNAAIVTPGIRPTWAASQDQKRIMTPKDAFAAGASHIVIGRPITQAENPADAFKRVCDEL